MDDSDKIQQFCDELKSYSTHKDRILSDLEKLCSKYKHFGERNPRRIRKEIDEEKAVRNIKRRKKEGSWNLMKELHDEYLVMKELHDEYLDEYPMNTLS
uniref:Uncharacterized protein n=1 Tax=Marseillevirus LCMAC101 TaxID=2506602 RepID=A0A481YR17_9VIRU|nr:MAG: hypothetical protein LCMAC101_00170 [Marseillevirus LCMAC101]